MKTKVNWLMVSGMCAALATFGAMLGVVLNGPLCVVVNGVTGLPIWVSGMIAAAASGTLLIAFTLPFARIMVSDRLPRLSMVVFLLCWSGSCILGSEIVSLVIFRR